MPSPPPPTREVTSVIGQLDAFAEVAKSWQGAISELVREQGSASTRQDDRPVDERDGAGRSDQSEKKRPRSRGEPVAEGRSFLHSGGGSCSSDMTHPSPAFGGYPNPAFGGTPHPNSSSLAMPDPTRPVRESSLTTAVSSRAERCAGPSAVHPEGGCDRANGGAQAVRANEAQEEVRHMWHHRDAEVESRRHALQRLRAEASDGGSSSPEHLFWGGIAPASTSAITSALVGPAASDRQTDKQKHA